MKAWLKSYVDNIVIEPPPLLSHADRSNYIICLEVFTVDKMSQKISDGHGSELHDVIELFVTLSCIKILLSIPIN